MRALLFCPLLLVVVQDESRRAFFALLRRAIELSGKTELQHCQDAGIKQSNWSAQCSGQHRFSGESFIRMDPEVRRWFALLTLQAFGLPREVNQAAPAIKRMARMDMETVDEKRTA